MRNTEEGKEIEKQAAADVGVKASLDTEWMTDTCSLKLKIIVVMM